MALFSKKNSAQNQHTRAKGAEGEAFVADYLIKNGYTIAARNFFVKGGEIDIVAQKGSLIVFVEVRSWDKVYWEGGSPLETILPHKIKRIKHASLLYIQKHAINLQCYAVRYDVAGLVKAKNSYTINYIENAFY